MLSKRRSAPSRGCCSISLITEIKGQTRRRLRQCRKGIGGQRRTSAQHRVAERLLAWSFDTSPAVIGVYAALGSEVSVDGAADAWLRRGHRLVWPRVLEEGVLSFHFAEPELLEPGCMGIREPSLDAPVAEVGDIDLLILPGLGFDRFGGRLGQGGGYYDRFLSHPAFRAQTVGVAFAVQVLPRLQLTQTDRRVDAVLTEQGVAQDGIWSL
jgi:5-formyltetrahydrofolate cyclo-ligase